MKAQPIVWLRQRMALFVQPSVERVALDRPAQALLEHERRNARRIRLPNLREPIRIERLADRAPQPFGARRWAELWGVFARRTAAPSSGRSPSARSRARASPARSVRALRFRQADAARARGTPGAPQSAASASPPARAETKSPKRRPAPA